MDLISIIVPCYNEEESLPLFYREVSCVLESMPKTDYELLFINDGSSDNTLSIIKELSENNHKIKYASFSRNFGKEAAMYLGLQKSKGDYVVIMDADLQHPPALLIEMYHAIKTEGIDCACAKRTNRRGEGKIRAWLTKDFYKIINRISEIEMVDGVGDFRMMSRQMVDAVLLLKEYNRYSKGLFSFVGFETKWIPYENVTRVSGATKWSFLDLFKYAVDGIVSFSTVPLVITSIMGMVFCIVSVIVAVFTAFKTLIYGNPVDGWTTLVFLVLFLGGLQMMFLGIAGQYLSKAYLEVKHRPIYIIKETNIK